MSTKPSGHAADIIAALGDDWLPILYRDRVRPMRTRILNLEIATRENTATIQHTLLGIELKVGNRRFPCPDLATARYMRTFARIGCREFAIPYDITRISLIADDLETVWQKALLLVNDSSRGRNSRSGALRRSGVIRAMRDSINEIGHGDAMPAFDRPTRQRPSDR